MSKGLASYPASQRLSVAMRRTQNPIDKGNGYWAAVDYLRKVGAPLPSDKKHAKAVIQSAMVADIKSRGKK